MTYSEVLVPGTACRLLSSGKLQRLQFGMEDRGPVGEDAWSWAAKPKAGDGGVLP
jgi:hypothetical protein